MSVTCALLAPSGPQKSRILSNLHKDVRSSKLEQFEVLDKMYLGKIIKKPDVQTFEEMLEEH
jgi:COP9 signalosome complex subunit 4